MLKNGALTGIKVLDLSRLLPGPFCSMILADHGAEVIAIEDVRFQADDLFFNDLNRNKRHMSLNLKSEKGREIFYHLAKEADVILEGFRPGVVDRLGVGYEVIQSINPGIIYCSISGYGQTGPCRDLVGHDINYLSRAGILDLCGEKDGAPSVPGVQIGDIAGGSMNAVIGIVMALFAREKTGTGQYIDISMTDGLLGFLILPDFLARREQKAMTRGDTMLAHRYGCYNVYRTSDDRYFSIGAVEHRFWKNMCEKIDRQHFVRLQYDDAEQVRIIHDLRELFATKNLHYWRELLSDAEVCFAEVKQPGEVWQDELFNQRQMIYHYTDETGCTQRSFGIPVKLSGTPGKIRSKPCGFGADTDTILAECGLTREEIIQLKTAGVVWGAETE